MEPRDFTFPGPGGELAGRVFLPDGRVRAKAVIAHGLHSSMASQKLTDLARALAGQGLVAMQFDHAGCGLSPGEVSQTTLSARRDEFLAATAACPGGDAPLVYLGSSMGGTAALLAAAARPPACSIHWSTPWDYYDLMRRLGGQQPPPDLPLLPRDILGLDLEGLLGRSANICFIHGQDDEVVPVAQAKRGFDLASQPKDLLIIPDADHRLSRPADQQTAIAHTIAWIARFVG